MEELNKKLDQIDKRLESIETQLETLTQFAPFVDTLSKSSVVKTVNYVNELINYVNPKNVIKDE